jgi:hypothetical protein
VSVELYLIDAGQYFIRLILFCGIILLALSLSGGGGVTLWFIYVSCRVIAFDFKLVD